MSGAGGRVLRAIAAVVVLVCTAGCTFVAVAWLADRVSEQSDEVVQPPIEDPVLVPGPATSTDGEAPVEGQAEATVDPGAVVTMEEAAPAVDGLPGGAWVLPVDLVATGETPTVPSTETTTQPDASGATTGTTVIPAEQAASTAEQLGAASLQPPLTAARFVDRCTEGATPCPLGVAATVKPFGTGTEPGKLAIRVWPGLNKALVPNLRCDPGSPSASTLPVLVTANKPLDSLDLSLELPDGTVLSKVEVGASASESAWAANTQQANLGTDLDNGLHYCATVPTLGDPAVAAALQAAGKSAPVPLSYRLRAVARTPADPAAPNTPPQEAVAVVDVPVDAVPAGTGGRPNTIVQPLNGHVAQVVVPERSDMSARPTVWVANAAYWKDKIGLGSATGYCTKAPPGTPDPAYYDPPKPVLLPAQQSYDPGQLAQPSYPFDPAYTHYGVWNAVLEEGTTYALCISWPLASGEEREAWTLETPNGLRFSLSNLFLIPNGTQPYKTWYLRADDVKCYASFPPLTQGGSYCRSLGLPYPPVVTFEHVAEYPTPYTGVGIVTHDLGSTMLQTPTWCPGAIVGVASKGSTTVQAAGGSTSLLAQCLSGTKDIRIDGWPFTFYYGDPNVLCGSDSCVQEHRKATVRTVATVEEGNSNDRSRDPLDWGITGPAGDRSASPGGSAPGPTGP